MGRLPVALQESDCAAPRVEGPRPTVGGDVMSACFGPALAGCESQSYWRPRLIVVKSWFVSAFRFIDEGGRTAKAAGFALQIFQHRAPRQCLHPSVTTLAGQILTLYSSLKSNSRLHFLLTEVSACRLNGQKALYHHSLTDPDHKAIKAFPHC
jgi:hypothetical protein